jgi:hypothetical protein
VGHPRYYYGLSSGEETEMTIKQLIRRLKENAYQFACEGDIKKSIACLECSAMLVQKGYENISGHIDFEENGEIE